VKISTTRGTPTGLPGVSRENLTKMLPGHLRNPSWLSEKLTFTRLSAKMPIKKAHIVAFVARPAYQKRSPFAFIANYLSKKRTF